MQSIHLTSHLKSSRVKKVIKTKWVINSRPGQQGSSLKARFVAKDFSQTINNPAVETFAATPSLTSLRTLLLKSILRQWDVISLDISAAFINAPIQETIYVQPPPELYHDQPHLLWQLEKALYALKSSPKLWADHLHGILTSPAINLKQLKVDRCVDIGDNRWPSSSMWTTSWSLVSLHHARTSSARPMTSLSSNM